MAGNEDDRGNINNNDSISSDLQSQKRTQVLGKRSAPPPLPESSSSSSSAFVRANMNTSSSSSSSSFNNNNNNSSNKRLRDNNNNNNNNSTSYNSNTTSNNNINKKMKKKKKKNRREKQQQRNERLQQMHAQRLLLERQQQQMHAQRLHLEQQQQQQTQQNSLPLQQQEAQKENMALWQQQYQEIQRRIANDNVEKQSQNNPEKQEERKLLEEEKRQSKENNKHALNGYFEDEDEEEEDEAEEIGSNNDSKKNVIYALYKPKKLAQGSSHPDAIVETSNLSMVSPPDIKYQHHLHDIVEKNGISSLQLEAVVYAYQRFESPLIRNSNGEMERRGFFLGDGAGVGKGRQIAATCIEHFRSHPGTRRKRRVLWVSVSQDLKVDSERDIRDLTDCCEKRKKPKIPIHPPDRKTIPTKKKLTYPNGILFSTYSLLSTGLGKNFNKKAVEMMEGHDVEGCSNWEQLAPKGTRLRQFIQWLKEEDDEDPLIIFDECHKAKNLAFAVTSKEDKENLTRQQINRNKLESRSKNATKTALAVIALQNALPKARILYASATGASEPSHLAYMQRLGLWGNSVLDNPFDDFQSFLDLVGKRHGMSAMEVFSMGMKQQGMYLSRQLSYNGAEFNLKKTDINLELLDKYNKGVIFFQLLFNVFNSISKYMTAAQKCGGKASKKSYCWDMKQFWAAHQRFFRSMLMSAKVPTVVEEARRAIKDGKCVVIGLQSTGESAVNKQMKDSDGGNNEEQDDFVSAPKMTITNLVEKGFHCLMERDNPLNHSESHRLDTLFVQMSQCVQAWEDLENGSSFNFDPRMNSNTASPSGSRFAFPSTAASSFNRCDDDDSDSDIEIEQVKTLDEVLAEKRAKAILTGAFIDLEDDTNIVPEAEVERQDIQYGKNFNQNQNSATSSSTYLASSSSTVVASSSTVGRASRGAKLKAQSFIKTMYDDTSELVSSDEEYESESTKGKGKEKEKDIKPVIGDMNTKIVDLCSDTESDDEDNSDDDFVENPCKRTSNFTKREVMEKKPILDDIKSSPVSEDIDHSNTDDMDIEFDNFEEVDQETQYIENSRMMQIKRLLLRAIDLISLPANPLDALIDQLGGREKVAELTGRKGSLVRDPVTKKCTYQNRNDFFPMKEVNLQEKQKFMNDDKLIAIISDAASCGISLQADRRVKNQRRRLHITLELPWSAEKAIQQFGRSHRSNQSSAPEYMIVITNLGGEKRFASAAAKRLSSLGAILKGDRRALGAGTNLKEFDIDNKYGTEALKEFYQILVGNQRPNSTIPMPEETNGETFIVRSCKNLMPVGIIEEAGKNSDGSTKYALHKSLRKSKNYSVARFLNRVLGTHTTSQNEIFDYFSALFDATVQRHKDNGDYNKGVVETRATSTRIVEDNVLYEDPQTMAKTRVVTVELNLGRDWASINEIYEKNIIESTKQRNKENEARLQNQNDANSSKFGKENGFYIRRTEYSTTPFVLLATEISSSYKHFRIRRPENDFSSKMYREDMLYNYRRVPKEDTAEFRKIERLWKHHYDKTNTEGELRRLQYQYLLVDPLPIWRLCGPIIREKFNVCKVEGEVEGEKKRILGISLSYNVINTISKAIKNADGDLKKALEK